MFEETYAVDGIGTTKFHATPLNIDVNIFDEISFVNYSSN